MENIESKMEDNLESAPTSLTDASMVTELLEKVKQQEGFATSSGSVNQQLDKQLMETLAVRFLNWWKTEADYQRVKADLANLQSKHTVVVGEKQELEAKAGHLEKEVENWKHRYEVEREVAKQLKMQVGELGKDKTALEVSNEKLRGELAVTNREKDEVLKQAQARVQKVEAKNAELVKKVMEERERYSLLSKEFEELNTKMAVIIGNVTHLNTETSPRKSGSQIVGVTTAAPTQPAAASSTTTASSTGSTIKSLTGMGSLSDFWKGSSSKQTATTAATTTTAATAPSASTDLTASKDAGNRPTAHRGSTPTPGSNATPVVVPQPVRAEELNRVGSEQNVAKEKKAKKDAPKEPVSPRGGASSLAKPKKDERWVSGLV